MTTSRLYLGAVLLAGVLPGSGWAGSTDLGGGYALPTWRLEVRPYSSGQSDVSLGVYRRVTSRWDLGCELSSMFSNRHDTGSQEELTQLDDSPLTVSRRHSRSTSLDLSVGFRRWYGIASRAGWYLAPRVRLGNAGTRYDYWSATPQEYSPRQSWSTGHNKELAIGVDFALGADLHLLDRLSVTFALRPLQYSYRWSESDAKQRLMEEDAEPREARSEGSSETAFLVTDFTPEVFLVLHVP